MSHNKSASCPVAGSPSGGSSNPKKQVSHHIDDILTRPVERHHGNYLPIKKDHKKDMHNIVEVLENAGARVEDGINKAKDLLSQSHHPDKVRNALAIYMTHSKDAQKRKIHPPALKDLPEFQRLKQDPNRQLLPTKVQGEVVTVETLRGPSVLSYWRDDYDMNDSRYHWHMVFRGAGGDNSVNKRTIDRQGELFLYVHSQMVARYETEGLCWGLPLVRSWSLYNDVLEYGYQPMPALQEYYGGYPPWSSWYRVYNPDLQATENVTITVGEMENWRDRIYDAIETGWVKTVKKDPKTGERIKESWLEMEGHDCLNYIGGLLDAQYAFFDKNRGGFAPDDQYYGILHTYGMGKFAEMTYRNNDKEQVPYGLMISNVGAPRDPCFFPWYKHMQDFGRLTAAKYPQNIRDHAADVQLSGLVIRPTDKDSPLYEKGGVETFLSPPAVDMMESKAKLDHYEYEWAVNVKSSRGAAPTADNPQTVTLRFFIAAKELVNYYHHWIEMDKVTVTLKSGDSITSVRADHESTVARKMDNYGQIKITSKYDYTSMWCRCGWPQNLMLPAGRPEGMPFVAFCMATNDVLNDEGAPTPATSFCGSVDDKYPDPRGIGYPFDRAWDQVNGAKDGKTYISTVIRDEAYPFIAASDFNIYRTTRYTNPAAIPPSTGVTWDNTIKNYFEDRDVKCMRSEYGYNLSHYPDVAFHAPNILYAVASGRMPLQMEGEESRRWSKEMCDKFREWTLNDTPQNDEDLTKKTTSRK